MTTEEARIKFPFAKIGDGVVIGDRVVIGNRVVIGDGVKIGDRVVIGDGVVIGDRVTRILYIQPSGGHAITVCGDGYAQIGCKRDTVAGWLEKYQAVGMAEKYSPAKIAEYGFLLRMAAEWLAREEQA